MQAYRVRETLEKHVEASKIRAGEGRKEFLVIIWHFL